MGILALIAEFENEIRRERLSLVLCAQPIDPFYLFDFNPLKAWPREYLFCSCSIPRYEVRTAHIGQSKIKSRLIADLDPDEWDLPPKPKWMRWRTSSSTL
jgi:hypothetical protein